MKTVIRVCGAAVIIGIAVGGLMILKRPARQETARPTSARVVAPQPSGNPSLPAARPIPTPELSPAGSAVISESSQPQTKTQTAPAVKPRSAANKKPKGPLHDPDARVALSLVGIEPEAEAYWAAAINDPSLPANERQDLIEDLNEEGFADPQHPSPEDLPLIMMRIITIEDHWPFAMDKVNDEAFREAYKDLVNMYARLTQR